MKQILSKAAVFLHLKRPVPHLKGWRLYLCVFTILLSETAALTLLKQYSISGYFPFLLGGFLGYATVSTLLIQSYKYEGMGIVNVLWSAFSVLFVVLAGMIFFGEHISTREWCGTALIIAGVIILRLPTKQKKMKGGQCLHVVSSDIPSLS